MKRKQVNAILVDQTIRKRKILNYIFIIIALTVLFSFFLSLYILNNKVYYVNYKENSELDYKVYLKENEFFDTNYLGKDRQYIASIIDYIDANFNYELEVDDKDIDYQYSYKIVADVDVKEKNSDNSLYSYSKVLEQKDSVDTNSNTDLIIYKDLKIDYNYYNELIKKFVNTYGLDDTESTLTISMYVNVLGNCDSIDFNKNESVISLVIPLTTKTVGIDISYDLLDEDLENIMICRDSNYFGIILIILMIITLGADVYYVVVLSRYVVITRTAETIYDKELKKILNNYKSYIQKINNEFDLRGYQVLKVDTFNDMLEIRDTVCEPILMVENKEKTGVFFLIPSKNKILYSYSLKVSTIKKEIRKNEYSKKS